MQNWLVVAIAARARVLEEADVPGAYKHRADLVHAQSRQKGVDLGSDRPGQVEGPGHGVGRAAYQPRTDVRVREHMRFAQEVAALLNEGVARGSCCGLVLVASNPFLGQLKSHLSEHARKFLLKTVASDFTSFTDKELARRLAEQAAAR